MQIELPVRPGAGAHSFTLSIAYHVSGRESISAPLNCPPVRLNAHGDGSRDCRVEAAYFVSITASLVDLTASVSYPSGSSLALGSQSYLQNYTGCVAGNCSYRNVTVGSQGTNQSVRHGALNFSVSMVTNSSHRYTFQLWISVSAGAFCIGYPGASAFARDELTGPGNFVRLQALTIT